jgi:hypothetical protein
MKKIYLVVFVILTIFKINAQPDIEWKKCYGGSNYDGAKSIQQTQDGGYIVTGHKYFYDDTTSIFGSPDYWILKLNSEGDTIWTKKYGGSKLEYSRSIQQTPDDGYIVAGYANSIDGDVSNNHGLKDYWILKLDTDGDTVWTKCLGGSSFDYANSILCTIDGGYIVAGQSRSSDGDISVNYGQEDYWIVKLNTEGAIIWSKSYGGSGHDIAKAVMETTDSMLIVVGITTSDDHFVHGHNGLGYDYWILKLNSEGDTIWTKCYGNSKNDWASSITQSSDGGFVIAGTTEIENIDNRLDFWILKLNSEGDSLWSRYYGGSGWDLASSIKQTSGGGYIVAGRTNSSDGDVWGGNIINDSIYDYWTLKLNSEGDTLWTKCFGGSNEDKAYSIQQTQDGGYIVAGQSNSNDGDVEGNHGNGDFWIVKLSSFDSTEEISEDNEFSLHPNPTKDLINIEFQNKGNNELKITNINGKLMLNMKLRTNKTQIEISEYPTGIYFITVSGDDFIKTKKIIKY